MVNAVFFLLSLRIPTLTDDFTTRLFVQGPNVSDKCQQLVGHDAAGVYSFLTWHFLSDCPNEQCGGSGRVRRGKNTRFRFDWLLLNNNIWFCFFPATQRRVFCPLRLILSEGNCLNLKFLFFNFIILMVHCLASPSLSSSSDQLCCTRRRNATVAHWFVNFHSL